MNETEKYRVLTLVLTYNCNLACDYCFCGRKRKENMSAEKAKEAIDFFMKNAEENANIVFFGGEPLLQADLIREVIRYCRERYGERTTFSITTNGTLLTKENVALIEDNHMAITLSLDGLGKTHDLHRKFTDGRPSFDVIMKNVNENGLNKANVSLRLTVTRKNLSELAENVISLHGMGFPNLTFTPASDPEDPYTEEDIAIFKNQIDRVTEYVYRCYQENHPIKILWYHQVIKGQICGGCSKCMEGTAQISVTPEGDIYPCDRIDFSSKELCMGNIADGLDGEKLRRYREEASKEDPECEGCSLKNRCIGCHIENLAVTGKVWEKPWYYCMMSQYVIQSADALAGKLYEEKNPHFLQRYYGGRSPE